MAKTIEQIIDDMEVPEMEYDAKYEKAKTKSKSKQGVSVTLDQIPEVVLPKTKTEVYNEAKVRLTQKTSATKHTGEYSGRTVQKPKKVKTVELEIAAVSAESAGSVGNGIKLRRRMIIQPVQSPRWVGDADELIPFAWRHPLIDGINGQTKFYRKAVREAKELMLPALRDK